MSEPSDSMELLIERQRTEQEKLRLERAKLRWSRSNVVVALWVVLAAICIAGIFGWSQDAAEDLVVGFTVFGGLATIFLLAVL